MSQKTNPLSLRLEKGNISFSSSWFTDFFFTDSFQYEAGVQKYINLLLKETQYSKAFSSLKNGYRKVNVLLYIQDTRVQQKEKQLLFNVKPSFSRAGKNPPVKKIFYVNNQESSKNFLPERLLFALMSKSNVFDEHDYHNYQLAPSQTMLSSLPHQRVTKLEAKKVGVDTFSVKSPTKQRIVLNENFKNCFFLLFRKKIIESFLKIRQNYNFSVYPKFSTEQSSYQIPLFYELCSLNFYPFTKHSSVKVLPNNNIKQYKVNQIFDQTCFWSLYMRQKYLKNKMKNRHCFAFCEKIVRKEILREVSAKKKQFFPVEKECAKQIFAKHSFLSKTESFFGENLLSTPQFSKNFQTLNRAKLLSIFSENYQKGTIHFEPIRFISDHQNQISLLDQIIVLLEKRISFKEITSKMFRDIEKNELVKGIRISCSGRFGGRSKKAQKSKLQSYQWGENSLNTFCSKVVFASKNANTSYGKIGVKLWISFKNNTR